MCGRVRGGAGHGPGPRRRRGCGAVQRTPQRAPTAGHPAADRGSHRHAVCRHHDGPLGTRDLGPGAGRAHRQDRPSQLHPQQTGQCTQLQRKPG